jgi:hypothetical protein
MTSYEEALSSCLGASGHCRTLVEEYLRTDVIQVAWAKRAKCHVS